MWHTKGESSYIAIVPELLTVLTFVIVENIFGILQTEDYHGEQTYCC